MQALITPSPPQPPPKKYRSAIADVQGILYYTIHSDLWVINAQGFFRWRQDDIFPMHAGSLLSLGSRILTSSGSGSSSSWESTLSSTSSLHHPKNLNFILSIYYLKMSKGKYLMGNGWLILVPKTQTKMVGQRCHFLKE